MWLSANQHKPTTAHTDPDCPYFPDDIRPVTDADVRRGISLCDWCRVHEG